LRSFSLAVRGMLVMMIFRASVLITGALNELLKEFGGDIGPWTYVNGVMFTYKGCDCGTNTGVVGATFPAYATLPA
jgi:hypothetical protein